MGPDGLPPGVGELGEARFERRMVQIRGPLDDGVAADVAARLMTLDALGDDPIEVIVDAADGTLDAALAVADTIDLLGVPTHAMCLGRVEGPPVLVLAVADRRAVSPNARIRLSVPSVTAEVRAGEAEAWLDQHRDRVDRFVLRLAHATDQRIERVREDLLAGRSFDADEAVGYGIVDGVRRPATRGTRR